jgi:hypothetical protein
MKEDIESAAAVLWGDWKTWEDDIIEEENPESFAIAQDWLDHLSKEAKQLLELVLKLPDEMFTTSGKIKKNELVKVLREEFKWKFETIKLTWKELQEWL